MICTTIVLGARPLKTRPITNAVGRKRPVILGKFRRFELPLLEKADIQNLAE